MNDELLEQLLNEDESPSLDFKRDQYPFEEATNEKKSELLKDVLAFANAWRRTDAYILIGVDEAKGGRSRVVGVQQHLDDAKLQQFVNSKTQRPVEFSYQAYALEGVEIGIITIPMQERPLYLKKDFGKLKKGVVYIRRGSSTDKAKPDEVAKMGAAAVQAMGGTPVLDLQFADIGSHKELGPEIAVKSIILEPRLDPAIFGPMPTKPWWDLPDFTNPRYYDELIEYVAESALLAPVGFMIENNSSEVALGVQLKATTMIQEGVRLVDEKDAPVRPSRSILSRDLPAPFRNFQPDPIVDNYGDHWELIIDFGKVLPRSKIWSTGVIYIGGDNSQTLHIEAALYAENLPDPTRVPLVVRIETEKRAMERRDVQLLIAQDRD